MTISLDLTNKLPAGLVEVYSQINQIAVALGIPILIVGATARDIILVHGFGAAIERGTRDVDFGIEVQNWQHYQILQQALQQAGFAADPQKAHRFSTHDSAGMPWEVDLIPFGNVSNPQGQILWPPTDDVSMTVLGFAEAYATGWDIMLTGDPRFAIKVASPAGILLLKLIAWTERGQEFQGKDASDIYYLIRHYSKIPSVYDLLHDEGYMAAQDYDDIKASALKLADEVRAMAHSLTLTYLRIQLLDDAVKRERLVSDIAKHSRIEYEEVDSYIKIVCEVLSKSHD
ncbi:nucleotidyl transferase AbiEii/AbiGii toxin family protein [Rheinheimera hassiensis]|uniref:nucleotidyl transferase AbiEii/AbiGii toxin family protein n=1 Tax=Rheinheimera hassiensis TaxID=1193627 RepID=UPI001F06A5BE|nr:nucleotidyl transferase AbiEii/AbiGii toxin family protein [Rheinheimera hassiensis]